MSFESNIDNFHDWVEVSNDIIEEISVDIEDSVNIHEKAARKDLLGEISAHCKEDDKNIEDHDIAIISKNDESGSNCPSANLIGSDASNYDHSEEEDYIIRHQLEAMRVGLQHIHLTLLQLPLRQNGLNCSSKSAPLEDIVPRSDLLSTYLATELHETFSLLDNLNESFRQNECLPRISFLSFDIGDIVLFLVAFSDNRRIWMAFNSQRPNYFLADDSLDVFLNKGKAKDQRTNIIGRIICIEERIAAKDNQYRLAVGTQYHLCYAEPLYRSDITGVGHSSRGSKT